MSTFVLIDVLLCWPSRSLGYYTQEYKANVIPAATNITLLGIHRFDLFSRESTFNSGPDR